MHKMISVPTPALLGSFQKLDHIVSFLSVKEVGNLFFVEKSINASIKYLLKCFSDRHTSFNTSISTAVQTEHLTLMKELDRSIRFFRPTSPRWAPLSTQLPAEFSRGGFGENYNEIAYSIGYLSENPVNSPILVAAGVHIPLSELLIDPQATPVAKQWAALALANLSVDPANRPILVADGVHNQLRALLIDPQATPLAKERAAGGLYYLSRNPANRQPLVDAGVHNQLSALLSDPQATPLAKQWAAGALENLEPTPRGFCVIS